MVKLNIKADCSNSPKKQFLKDYTVAFAKGDTKFIIDSVSEDIHWVMIGELEVKGKEAFVKSVESMIDGSTEELTIDTIVTHGAEAAVKGTMVIGGENYAYSDFYEFVSAGKQIIKKITSMVIRIKS